MIFTSIIELSWEGVNTRLRAVEKLTLSRFRVKLGLYETFILFGMLDLCVSVTSLYL